MSGTRVALPELRYEQWAPTKKTLQMCAQMLGKMRLALSPPQPEWLHTALYLNGRGITTGVMPVGANVVEMGIDLLGRPHEKWWRSQTMLWVTASDGGSGQVVIGPDRCVADVWAELLTTVRGLGFEPDIWDKPQETTDTTPFSENRHDCVIDSLQVQEFFRLLAFLQGVYEQFRSQFFGRSGIQLWWGAFDFAVLLFSGKKEVAPEDRGYIMRYDLDAQHMNAGFWPGDDDTPTPAFYGYLVPRPEGCEAVPVEPGYAHWVETMGEWVMPYDEVRACDDPRGAILDFLRSVYRVALTLGGWDEQAYRYVRPVPPART